MFRSVDDLKINMFRNYCYMVRIAYLEFFSFLVGRTRMNRVKFIEADQARRPPLWSSGQTFWLQIQRSRVRLPALPDFLTSRGSGTGSTQPRDHN
jgi:hypothetical protein